MEISKYVSYLEAVKSNTAVRRGIENTPNEQQLEAMRNVAVSVFDKVREKVGGPLAVTSFFRSPKLNKAIGGSGRSQHCRGEAIDIDCDVFGNGKNSEVFKFIKEELDFDQLIWEFGNDEEPAWVHVSLKLNGQNRKSILKAVRREGKTKYVRI